MRDDSMNPVSRRGILLGTAALGGLSLAGCGGLLAKTTDIPVGGGKVYAERGIVVTQPTANDFKAFKAKCTHAGCAVSKVENGVIVCPCHGSTFSAVDGSGRNGPATKPLSPSTITVEGADIRVLE
ncbi:Rieske (2Fe-2S) protein [Planosporangium flavigriseum]|uniref:Cytochrome bc1 complex Rieske iron-sulfur subunit n=1 Tax=Planosporangium flavigriseum TaxID=373681 RepID=A0A8J3PQ88_9ACTN|nr:Rieske (2Fe-2S) protein [Planosporangium flavigriseum]NJC66667.1 Rieske (2Fe-2S) protein [Planosporangium flavigriseum]GIG76698.1 iron-sulfur protein [Planosporangium flavigriseum]